jgi:Na+/H+ antiporter NhaD/arsenite permease-like protein
MRGAARAVCVVGLLTALLVLIPPLRTSSQSGAPSGRTISGRLEDPQRRPVVGATITARSEDAGSVLGLAESQDDGSWVLLLDRAADPGTRIEIARHHFEQVDISLDANQAEGLRLSGALNLGVIPLVRRITPAFWAAAIIFVAVLVVIALERLHSTTAALAGMSAVFLVTFIGGIFNPELYIFNFKRAITYINWEVIFLVMGMMIIIAIIEGTGIFQWTAFQAYRASRGRAWVLVLILMGVTGLASALLDNFTTMLLMTPISLQIALALGINPLAFIIPEVLSSNISGISTLIGTPTNILIGAFADISFSDFLVNQTAGVLLAMVVAAGFVLYFYRREWSKQSGGISPRLYERMRENARLEDPKALMKSAVVFVLVLVGFVLGERIHIVPAVPALVGATVLLVWLNPDVQKMIKAVDWTTLVFFIAIFIVIGAVQEVGLVSLIAGAASRLIGENLPLGIFAILFGVGTLSVAIANIPLTASMLPIVEFLSGSVPGANSKVLYYALSMGAAMGGNGFLIGGEANIVTAGISEQAGTPISFAEFLKIGLPVTYLTMVVGFLWLLVRFVLLAH